LPIGNRLQCSRSLQRNRLGYVLSAVTVISKQFACQKVSGVKGVLQYSFFTLTVETTAVIPLFCTASLLTHLVSDPLKTQSVIGLYWLRYRRAKLRKYITGQSFAQTPGNSDRSLSFVTNIINKSSEKIWSCAPVTRGCRTTDKQRDYRIP